MHQSSTVISLYSVFLFLPTISSHSHTSLPLVPAFFLLPSIKSIASLVLPIHSVQIFSKYLSPDFPLSLSLSLFLPSCFSSQIFSSSGFLSLLASLLSLSDFWAELILPFLVFSPLYSLFSFRFCLPLHLFSAKLSLSLFFIRSTFCLLH